MRLLKANEIEVRVGSCKEKGASLLLYKNARVDMQIMDETFGTLNWKREHIIINDNNYCRVSVYNDIIKEWISKEDCGTESATEKEKGEASDSFKRACVNWGIGRELYTSPFLWITKITVNSTGGKHKTNDKFKVKEISYNEDREIENLIIVNGKNEEVFNNKGKCITLETKPQESNSSKPQEQKTNKPQSILSDKQTNRLYSIAKAADKTPEQVKLWIIAKWKKTSVAELTRKEYDELCNVLESQKVK